MQPTDRRNPIRLAVPPTRAAAQQIPLGTLVESVARMLPERDVAPAVRALFDLGLVSFARPLSGTDRAAMLDSF